MWTDQASCVVLGGLLYFHDIDPDNAEHWHSLIQKMTEERKRPRTLDFLKPENYPRLPVGGVCASVKLLDDLLTWIGPDVDGCGFACSLVGADDLSEDWQDVGHVCLIAPGHPDVPKLAIDMQVLQHECA